MEEFGVWGEKKLYGKVYFGILRTTFIIDESGLIEQIILPKQVNTKEHAAQILNR
jgi:peroxiredoxin Q/BCP